MRRIKILLLFMFCAFLMQAQEKYAVLITGDYASSNFINRQNINIWNGGFDRAAMEEFWNDTFLMWEMLVDEFGYNPDNVFVLFADGVDYSNAGSRYKKYDDNNQYFNIVYDEASTISVENIFTDLRYGTNGRPQITDDDFLFVWTFDHGYYGSSNSYLCLLDGNMSDEEFADLVNPIPAYKKVFWMQQCNSGGFADDLENYNVYFSSAAQYNQSAYRADNRTINNNTVEENELVNNRTYYHGEYDFHIYSSTRGESPNYVNNYYGISYTNADVNNDNIISVTEAHDWNENYNSRANETSVESDLGEIGDYTSLKYPTTLFENITSNKTYKSLIAVTKDITITDGNTLKFDENSITYIINNSTLTVSNNSELECLGTLIIEGGGKLIIEDGGKLIYEQGTTISLSEDNSHIEIAGDLHIASNATFTFTGDGYIKFSKPGNDSETQDNIIAGTNASFVLEGTGKNDKKMEIQQSTVHFPELAELRFEDCKIEMGAGSTGLGARMQTSSSTSPITFENIKITSDDIGVNNSHRSFHLYGQSNVTINNCVFQNGKYGLYANLTYGGSGLNISNSVFQNNQYGLWIYNKCINITECDFYSNTVNAIRCSGMSHNSHIEDCNVINSPSGVYGGIVYRGSASANLEISYVDIEYASNNGIYTSGGFELDLNCSYISNCGTGLYAIYGNYVIPSANDIINNYVSIYLNNALIDLENKGNMLYSTNDDYALTGLIPLNWINCYFSPSLIATKNIWESDLNSSPQYGVNHELNVYGTGCNPPLPVTITDFTPGQLDCISFGNPLLLLNMVNNTENSTIFSTLCDDFSLLSTESAFQTEMATYCNAIENFEPTNTSEFLQKRKAYADAHKLLNAYYEHVAFNSESLGFNSAIDMLQDLNFALINTESETEYAKIDYDLDIGLLERYRGNYDAAISHLEALVLNIQEYEPELFFVEKWLCSLYAEKLLTEGSINHDEFDALIIECETRYEENMVTLNDKSPANDNKEGEENKYMQISPNPNDGSFTVNVNCEHNNAAIRISNSIGQPISTTALSNTGEQVLNITGLSIGQYTIYYIVEGNTIESEHVFVE